MERQIGLQIMKAVAGLLRRRTDLVCAELVATRLLSSSYDCGCATSSSDPSSSPFASSTATSTSGATSAGSRARYEIHQPNRQAATVPPGVWPTEWLRRDELWGHLRAKQWHGQLLPCGTRASHQSAVEDPKEDEIKVTFVTRDGEEKEVRVPLGTNMLEAAHENDIDLEGACEGSLACSTCHVIIMDDEQYETLPEPTDEENDMLDLAFGLTETSRLGCQVVATKELDGLRLAIPSATRNFAVDGHVPKPH